MTKNNVIIILWGLVIIILLKEIFYSDKVLADGYPYLELDMDKKAFISQQKINRPSDPIRVCNEKIITGEDVRKEINENYYYKNYFIKNNHSEKIYFMIYILNNDCYIFYDKNQAPHEILPALNINIKGEIIQLKYEKITAIIKIENGHHIIHDPSDAPSMPYGVINE